MLYKNLIETTADGSKNTRSLQDLMNIKDGEPGSRLDFKRTVMGQIDNNIRGLGIVDNGCGIIKHIKKS